MKTIIEKETKESLYLFEDSKPVDLHEGGLEVGDPIEIHDSWSNSTTTELITGVTAPANWWGRKYKYDGANGLTIIQQVTVRRTLGMTKEEDG